MGFSPLYIQHSHNHLTYTTGQLHSALQQHQKWPTTDWDKIRYGSFLVPLLVLVSCSQIHQCIICVFYIGI